MRFERQIAADARGDAGAGGNIVVRKPICQLKLMTGVQPRRTLIFGLRAARLAAILSRSRCAQATRRLIAGNISKNLTGIGLRRFLAEDADSGVEKKQRPWTSRIRRSISSRPENGISQTMTRK
jgi:hypothetical protein